MANGQIKFSMLDCGCSSSRPDCLGVHAYVKSSFISQIDESVRIQERREDVSAELRKAKQKTKKKVRICVLELDQPKELQRFFALMNARDDAFASLYRLKIMCMGFQCD